MEEGGKGKRGKGGKVKKGKSERGKKLGCSWLVKEF